MTKNKQKNDKNSFILASESKIHLQLLNQIGYQPSLTIPTEINEKIQKKETPKNYSIRIAKEKTEQIAKNHPDQTILAISNITCIGRRILTKTDNKNIIAEELNLISNRRCKIYTSICLHYPNNSKSIKTILSILKIKHLQKNEIKEYLQKHHNYSKDWQENTTDYFCRFIKWMSGSPSAIYGLPLYETANLLENITCKQANKNINEE